jgi:hypothetical protein
MHIRNRRIAAPGGLLFAACLLSAGASRADVTFGGNARAFAMGGAGIAVVDHSERNTLVNPAALALYNRRVRLSFPTIGLHASGISLRNAYNHLFNNIDKNDAVTLARDFGSQNSEFGANLAFGMRFGHFDATATGNGIVRVLPNAALQQWAKTANGDVSQLSGNERADMIGAGIYTLPTATFAERISPAGSPIHIEAGARVKLARSVYSHYIVTASNIQNNTAAVTAPELGGGTTLTKDGIGVDFGFLAHPRDHTGFSGALVVTNLIEPNFKFTGTDTTGAAVKYDLQPRSITVGSAYEAGRILIVADAVDLTRAYSNAQGRFGMEYRTRKIAFRGGYSSARGFTVGFGWGFVDLAFGAKAPLEVSQTLRF